MQETQKFSLVVEVTAEKRADHQDVIQEIFRYIQDKDITREEVVALRDSYIRKAVEKADSEEEELVCTSGSEIDEEPLDDWWGCQLAKDAD